MNDQGITHSDRPTEPPVALYLMPSTMSDAPVADVLPQLNIELARSLRYFIVENVRTARRFLKRCDRSIDIDQLTFFTLDEHTSADDVPAMLEPLAQGHAMGVISEAGCPAVADPGADAVAEAHRRGYKVVPLVGPSSIIMALMGSGMNGQSFAFAGYLPVDRGARGAKLREMTRRVSAERQTQIFIETPYRNNRLIAELAQTLPREMRLCVACDLTGERAEIATRTAAQWAKANYDYDKRPAIFLIHN